MAKDKTASDVSKMIKEHDVKLVDFKFTDLPGSWQHFTTTLTEYNEEIFTEGLGFDGSSIRGWRAINTSDMLVVPDPATAWIDVFNAEPTLSLICTIVDPIAASLVGILLLGEHLRLGVAGGSLGLAGLVMTIIGLTILARHAHHPSKTPAVAVS